MGEMESARRKYEEARLKSEEIEEMVEKIQSHFKNIFHSLLRYMPVGIVDGELSVVETSFGTIKLTDDGQVVIEPGVWEHMCDEFKRLDGMKGT